MIQLLLKEISDSYVRTNFQRIQDAFRGFALFSGKFKFYEIEISEAVTNYRYPHRLGFVPKDILQTGKIGSGSLTWNYDRFDKDYLDITTTGPCTVRAFVGTYQEGSQA